MSSSFCTSAPVASDVLVDSYCRITNEGSPGVRFFYDLVEHAVCDTDCAGSGALLDLSKRILKEFQFHGGRFLGRQRCEVVEMQQETENDKKLQDVKEQQGALVWYELNQDTSLAKVLSTLRQAVTARRKLDTPTKKDTKRFQFLQQNKEYVEDKKQLQTKEEKKKAAILFDGVVSLKQRDTMNNTTYAEVGDKAPSTSPPHPLKKRVHANRPSRNRPSPVPIVDVQPRAVQAKGRKTVLSITPPPPTPKERVYAKRHLHRNRPPPVPILAIKPRMVSLRKASAPRPAPAASAVPQECPIISATRTAEDELSASVLLDLHDSAHTFVSQQSAAAKLDKVSTVDLTKDDSGKEENMEEPRRVRETSFVAADDETVLKAEISQSANNLILLSSLSSASSLMAAAQRSLCPSGFRPYEQLLVASRMVNKTGADGKVPVNSNQMLDTLAAACYMPIASEAKKVHNFEPAEKVAQVASTVTRSYNDGMGGPATLQPRLSDSENDTKRQNKRREHSGSFLRPMRGGQSSGEDDDEASSKHYLRIDFGAHEGNSASCKQSDEEEALSTRSGESTSQDMEISGQSFSESASTVSPGEGIKARKRFLNDTPGAEKRSETAAANLLGHGLSWEQCTFIISNPDTSANETELALRVLYEQVRPCVPHHEQNKWQLVCRAQGIARVETAMRRHASRLSVQSSGCDLLLELIPACTHTARLGKGFYHAEGIIEVVLCAMRRHANSSRAVILHKALALLSRLIHELELECNRVLVCEDVVPVVLSILQQAVSSPQSDDEENNNNFILPFCGDILWHLSKDVSGREVIVGYGGAAAVSTVVFARSGRDRHVLEDPWIRTHFVRLHLRILQDYTGQDKITYCTKAMNMDQSPFSLSRKDPKVVSLHPTL